MFYMKFYALQLTTLLVKIIILLKLPSIPFLGDTNILKRRKFVNQNLQYTPYVFTSMYEHEFHLNLRMLMVT